MGLSSLHKCIWACLWCFLLSGCSSNTSKNKFKSLDSFNEVTADPDGSGTISFGGSEKEKKANIVKKFNSVLVFHADDTMEVKKVYIASLALAKNTSIDPIKEIVLSASEASDDKVIVDTTIELGKRMKADLIDVSPRAEPSFIIKPMGYDEQNMNKTKHSIWQWSIEPIKEGQHKLMLSVQVILSDDDRVNLPARNIPVTIFSKKVSFFSKVGGFFSNYWQWIITAIFLPIFIAWFTNSIKQRNEQKNKAKS